jgi:hypothetical protein
MPYHAAVMALHAAVALLAGSAVALELIPTKRTILVDEPLVVTLLAAGRGGADAAAAAGATYFLIEEGKQTRRYTRKAFAAVPREPSRPPVLAGRLVLQDIVLGFDAETNDWAFPRPGRYRLTAVHDEPGGASVHSNTVSIEVREPEGVDAEAHEALRPLRSTDLAAAINEQEPATALEPLAGRYPDSAYLHLPRAYDLLRRLHHAARGVDPYGAGAARQADVADAARRQELARGYYRALRPLLADMSEINGPLQPELLMRLAEVERSLGDARSQKAILRRVAHEFRRRPAGERAARELKDLARDEKIRRKLLSR